MSGRTSTAYVAPLGGAKDFAPSGFPPLPPGLPPEIFNGPITAHGRLPDGPSIGPESVWRATRDLPSNQRYQIEPTQYGVSIGGSTEIEMRPKYDYDPANKYRGEIESDGYVRTRNMNGDTLRGSIDSDGYGRLRDDDGNTIRVTPD